MVKVEDHMRLVTHTIQKYKKYNIEYDDLKQIGYLGLVKAANKFDENRGIQFSTYAVALIEGEIRRHLRDDNCVHIPRRISALKLSIEALRVKYSNQGKEFNAKNIAKELEIPEKDAEAYLNVCYMLSINKKRGNKNKPTEEIEDFQSSIIDEDANTEEKVINKITYEELIRELDDEERYILLAIENKKMSQSKIGKKLGCSQAQVSRRIKKIYGKLKTSVGIEGFEVEKMHAETNKAAAYQYMDTLTGEEIKEKKKIILQMTHRFNITSKTAQSYYYQWKRTREIHKKEVEREVTFCSLSVEDAKTSKRNN